MRSLERGRDGTGHGQPQASVHRYLEEGAGLTFCLPAVLQLDRSLCLELAGFVCELVRVELDLEPDLSANEVAISVERPVGPRRFKHDLERARRRTRRGHPGNSKRWTVLVGGRAERGDRRALPPLRRPSPSSAARGPTMTPSATQDRLCWVLTSDDLPDVSLIVSAAAGRRLGFFPYDAVLRVL